MSDPRPAADRNLLFGILALQMDFISRDVLIEAMHAWVLNKDKSLGQILVGQKALGGDPYTLLEALVAEHLKQHGNDPEKSLAALSSLGSVREDLAKIGDAELQASLAHVSAQPPTVDEISDRASAAVGMPPSSTLRYRILRPHAKGGLGEVFVALDQELQREVALKEIQEKHAHDAGSRARFLLEAEITGGLEHPGIVPVYGLGRYGDGRPFYAMRFIKGDNLKEAIRRFHEADVPGRDAGERSLALRQLLGRFIDVCNAVAYAHSRGVLHRDLKPGNIMLGKYGETLLVDWGLAKAVGRSEPGAAGEEGTLKPSSGSDLPGTQMGSAIGTPAFMSPEQAAGRLEQLGPGSDVYSLGATLYCLLTGKAPFHDGDKGEVLRKVQHGDFPRPRQVKRDVPPALEAVALKGMALSPEDRYAAPRDLGEEIEHWLADEPVAAYREPWPVRARRWSRKHPRTVTGLAAAVLVGVIGMAAGLFFVNAERERTELARQGEEAQRIEAERLAELARNNEKEAKDREAETKAVLDFVENKVFAAARPEGRKGGLGRTVTLRQAVEAALPFVDKSFASQPLIEARLRMTLGTSFWYLGDANIAADQYQKAHKLFDIKLGPDHPDTLASINNLANSYADLGRYAEALKLREETLALRKAKLGPDHSDTLASMNGLAVSYALVGRHADALKLFEQSLALRKAKLGPDHAQTLGSMNNLANSYADLGRHADALKLREETLALQKAKLGPDHPDTLMSMNNLANSYADLGQHNDALKLYEETLALQKAKLGPNHADTLGSMNNLANRYANLGRHADALKLREETMALMKAKLGPDHPDTLRSMNGLANSYADLGRHNDALKLYEATLTLTKAKLGPDHPDTHESMNNLASSYADLGRHAQALKLFEETLALRKAKLGPDHPNTLLSMGNLADSLLHVNRGVEAVALIDECVQRAAGKVVDPRLLPFVLELRVRHFEKLKNVAGCRATAEMWEKLNRTDAESLYQAACFRSVTAAVTSKTPGADATRLANEQAERAMAWLRKAVAAGYKNTAHMKKDPDLDPLRSREDFKKLLAELEKNEKSVPK